MKLGKVVLLFVFCFSVSQCVLYGLGSIGGPTQLITIDPRTGFQNPLRITLPTELDSQAVAAIDYNNRIYYFIGLNTTSSAVNLVGIDIASLTVSVNIPLPFSDSGFIGAGQTVNVNPNNGEVFVSGVDPSVKNYHHLVSVNPKTKVITSIAVIPDVSVLAAATCYDPKNDIVWLQFGVGDDIDLFRINVQTGNITTLPDTLNLETMDFDPVSGLIYSVGLQVISPTNYRRVMLTLDSATNEIKVVAEYEGYFIIWAGDSALDFNKRKHYSILQPVGNSNNPFQLVEFDLTTNKITNNPKIGGVTCNSCPASFHYSPT